MVFRNGSRLGSRPNADLTENVFNVSLIQHSPNRPECEAVFVNGYPPLHGTATAFPHILDCLFDFLDSKLAELYEMQGGCHARAHMRNRCHGECRQDPWLRGRF